MKLTDLSTPGPIRQEMSSPMCCIIVCMPFSEARCECLVPYDGVPEDEATVFRTSRKNMVSRESPHMKNLLIAITARVVG